MCTYYRAPKAPQQRSSDCTRLATKPLAAHVPCAWVFMYLLDLNICVFIIERARAAVVGLHVASGKATSRACAWVFMYLLDLNIFEG